MTKSDPRRRVPFELKHVAVLDTETSGLDPQHDRVLQWGVVVCALPSLVVEEVQGAYVDNEDDSWSWEDASAEALEVNGITREMTKSGIRPGQALDHVFTICFPWEETVLAGWGIDFDLAFAKQEFARQGKKPPFRYRVLDVRSVCLAVDLATAALAQDNGAHQHERIVYSGLGEWLERAGELPAVKELEQQGEFAYIDQLLDVRRAREHDAVADALQTVRALRIAQSLMLRGAPALWSWRQARR